MYDDLFTEFYSGSIILGWYNVPIATVQYLVEWHLEGGQSKAEPDHSTVSKMTVSTIFSGALFNGADKVPNAGYLISECSPQIRPAAGAGVLRSYLYKGCRLLDNENSDHNHVVQTSWTFSEYPGYWWFKVHSPVSHTDDKLFYRFGNATQLADGSVGAG